MQQKGNPTQDGGQEFGEREADLSIQLDGLPATISKALDLAANGDFSDIEDALYAVGYLERVLVEVSGSKRDTRTGEIVATQWKVVPA